ncbi:DUF6238 family protein [Streptomyces sp. RFCAC02]|uniref:DUF6238 family protein n=1 Tax=Streptomyces sp. RFCAC02 TaxID=2499143 RepID=UPI0010222DE8|nr:DUF6238 family protein [Streptomyces sp. RFCAC02]
MNHHVPAERRTPVASAHPDDADLYLRAATAGIRHHTRALTRRGTDPATRDHLDQLHAHLVELLRLLDHLTNTVRPQHPAAGRSVAEARNRLWEAATGIHAAFHHLPAPADGPPLLTICRRHLSASHAVRRHTTPSDLTREGPPR